MLLMACPRQHVANGMPRGSMLLIACPEAACCSLHAPRQHVACMPRGSMLLMACPRQHIANGMPPRQHVANGVCALSSPGEDCKASPVLDPHHFRIAGEVFVSM